MIISEHAWLIGTVFVNIVQLEIAPYAISPWYHVLITHPEQSCKDNATHKVWTKHAIEVYAVGENRNNLRSRSKFGSKKNYSNEYNQGKDHRNDERHKAVI